MTDQHNYRTLGCYRDYLISKNQPGQAYVWGEGVAVETPNIDILAKEGALFTNFHATAPLCTPNRASFVSGLYPAFTGADRNHSPMNDDVVTFAQVLKEERDYETGYFGKVRYIYRKSFLAFCQMLLFLVVIPFLYHTVNVYTY